MFDWGTGDSLNMVQTSMRGEAFAKPVCQCLESDCDEGFLSRTRNNVFAQDSHHDGNAAVITVYERALDIVELLHKS
jgi:hypothetical protein